MPKEEGRHQYPNPTIDQYLISKSKNGGQKLVHQPGLWFCSHREVIASLLFRKSLETIVGKILLQEEYKRLHAAFLHATELVVVCESGTFFFPMVSWRWFKLEGHVQCTALKLCPWANRQPDRSFLSLVFSYLSPTNGFTPLGEWGQEVAYGLCFDSLCGNFLIIGHTKSFHSPPWHLSLFM